MVLNVKTLFKQIANYFKKILFVKHKHYDFTVPIYKESCEFQKISDDVVNWSKQYDLINLPSFNMV